MTPLTGPPAKDKAFRASSHHARPRYYRGRSRCRAFLWAASLASSLACRTSGCHADGFALAEPGFVHLGWASCIPAGWGSGRSFLLGSKEREAPSRSCGAFRRLLPSGHASSLQKTEPLGPLSQLFSRLVRSGVAPSESPTCVGPRLCMDA